MQRYQVEINQAKGNSSEAQQNKDGQTGSAVSLPAISTLLQLNKEYHHQQTQHSFYPNSTSSYFPRQDVFYPFAEGHQQFPFPSPYPQAPMPMYPPFQNPQMEAAQSFEPQTQEELPSDVIMRLVSEPAAFQIANYNIYPSPAIQFDPPLKSAYTISMTLVDHATKVEVHDAFQGGETRRIGEGTRVMVCSGLKLKKMNGIKSELQKANIFHVEEFHLRFKVGNQTLDSPTFKLVSSCTQLPKEIKQVVRPMKRGRGVGIPKLSELEEELAIGNELLSLSGQRSPSPSLLKQFITFSTSSSSTEGEEEDRVAAKAPRVRGSI